MLTNENKAERIKTKDIPYVQYTDIKFVHEHGVPLKFSRFHDWINNHKIAGIALVILFIIFYALSLFDGFVSIPAFAIIWFVGVASVIESGRSQRRSVAFYEDLIKRGGVIIATWNNTFLKSYTVASLILIVIMFMMCGAAAGLFIWYKVTDREVQILTSYIPFCFSIFLNVSAFNNRGHYSSPTIFLDIDEGVLFGGAIFPYEVLSGLSYSGRNDNTFKLTYEGREVATGKILPEDWAYLHSMIDVSKKYKDYLVDEG